MIHWRRSSNPGIRCHRCVLGNFCRHERRGHLCSYIGFPKYHHVCILIILVLFFRIFICYLCEYTNLKDTTGQSATFSSICSYSWFPSPIIKLSLFQMRSSFVIRWTLANRWSSFTISGLGSLVLCLWGEVYSGISLIITNRFSWQSTPPQESKLKTRSEALFVGTALLGIGMASIFATGFLWVERRLKASF